MLDSSATSDMAGLGDRKQGRQGVSKLVVSVYVFNKSKIYNYIDMLQIQ